MRAASVVLFAAMNAACFGQVTWKRVFGAFDHDVAYDIVRTSAEEYVVVGSTGSFGNGSSDVYLFKVDSNGVRLWSKTYGAMQVDGGKALVETSDGGFVIAGSTNRNTTNGYDGLLLKVGPSGDPEWERTYGGPDWDLFNDVALTADGGLLAVGQTYSEGVGGDAWIVRLDAAGDTLWTSHFGASGEDEANSIISTLDGGAAWTGSVNDRSDAEVVKLDETGLIEWEIQVGGDSMEIGRDIIQTLDGGYSVVGATKSFASVVEQYHFKLDGSGSFQWEKHWGQVNHQEGFKHVQLPTGEYAAIGKVFGFGAGGSDMFLLKSDVNGDFILGQTQGGEDDEEGFALIRSYAGYVLCGVTESYGAGLDDIFLVKTNEIGFTDSDDVLTTFDPLTTNDLTSSSVSSLTLFPSPSSGPLTVRADERLRELAIWDVTGRQVFEQRSQGLDVRLDLDLPDGTYVLTATTVQGQVLRQAFILQRP